MAERPVIRAGPFRPRSHVVDAIPMRLRSGRIESHVYWAMLRRKSASPGQVLQSNLDNGQNSPIGAGERIAFR
jgi:hypothetical protein